MKKLTQKELLTEGFWSGFKPSNWGKVARGALRAGAEIARTVAPEIMNPVDDTRSALHRYKNSFTQGYDGIPDPVRLKSDLKNEITHGVANAIVNDIKIGLVRQNMQMISKYGIKHHGVDPENGNRLYMLKVITPQNRKGQWITVDSKGNIS